MSVVTELSEQKLSQSDFSNRSLTLRSVQHYEKDFFPLSSKLGRKGGNSFGVVEVSWIMESRVSTKYHFMSEHTIFLVRVRFDRLLEKDKSIVKSRKAKSNKSASSDTPQHQLCTSWRTITVRGGTRGESYTVRLYDVDQATNISAWVCAYRKDKGHWTNFVRARAVGFGADEDTNTLNLSLQRFVSSLDKVSRDEALKKCDGMTIDPSFGHVEGHTEVVLRVANSLFSEFIVSRTKRLNQILLLWGRVSLRSSEIKILDDRTLRVSIPPYFLSPPNAGYGFRNLREQIFVRLSVDDGSNWTVGCFTYIRNTVPPVHRPQIIQYWGADNTNKFLHENQISLPLRVEKNDVDDSKSTKIEDEDETELNEESSSSSSSNSTTKTKEGEMTTISRSRSAKRVFVNYESVKQSNPNGRPDLIFVTDTGEIFRVQSMQDSDPTIKFEDLETLITQDEEDSSENQKEIFHDSNNLNSKIWYPNLEIMNSAFTEACFLQQRCIQAFVEAIHPNTRYGNGIYTGDLKAFDKLFPNVRENNFFTDIYHTPLPQVYIGKNMNAQLRNLVAWRLDCSKLQILRNTQHQILWHRGATTSKRSSEKKKKIKQQNDEPVTPEHQVLLQMSPDESPCIEDLDARDLVFVVLENKHTQRHSHVDENVEKTESSYKNEKSIRRDRGGSFMNLLGRGKDNKKSRESHHQKKSSYVISLHCCLEELDNQQCPKISFSTLNDIVKDERKQMDMDDDDDTEKTLPESNSSENEGEPGILFTRKFVKRCEHLWSKAIQCVEGKGTTTPGNTKIKDIFKEIVKKNKDGKHVDEEFILEILDEGFEGFVLQDDNGGNEKEEKTNTSDDDAKVDSIDLESITVDTLFDSNLRQFLHRRLPYAEDQSLIKNVVEQYDDIWFKAEAMDALGLDLGEQRHGVYYILIESHSARYSRSLVLGYLVLKEDDSTSTMGIERMRMWGPVASHSVELKMIQFASHFASLNQKTLEIGKRLKGDATDVCKFFSQKLKKLEDLNLARLHSGQFVEKMHAILRVNDEVMTLVQEYSDSVNRKRMKKGFMIEAFENYKAEIALGLRVSTRYTVSAELNYDTKVGSGAKPSENVIKLDRNLVDIDPCMTIGDLKNMILERMERKKLLPQKSVDEMIENVKKELSDDLEEVRVVMNYKLTGKAFLFQKDQRNNKDVGNAEKFFAEEFPPFDESRSINYYFGHLINRRILIPNARGHKKFSTKSLRKSQGGGGGQEDSFTVNVRLDIVPKVHSVRSEWSDIIRRDDIQNVIRSAKIVCDESSRSEDLAFANLWVNDVVPNAALMIEHMEEFWFYRSVRSSVRQESQFLLSEDVRARILGVNRRNGVHRAGELEIDRPFQDGSRSMVDQIHIEWQRRKYQGRDELVDMSAGESFQVYLRRPHQRRCVESDCPRAPMVMCNKCSQRAGMPQMWCAYHMLNIASRASLRSVANRERSVWLDSHCPKCDEIFMLYTLPDNADVHCIGDNTDGQCGSRDGAIKKQLVKIQSSKWKDTRNVIMTSCGPGYTVAVANNSQGIVQIFAWGKGGGGCPQGKKGCKEPKAFTKFRYDQAGAFRVETLCSDRVLQYVNSESSKFNANTENPIKDKACREREIRTGTRWASQSRDRFDTARQVARTLTKELKTQYLIMAGRLYDVWNSRAQSSETIMIKLEDPKISYERESLSVPSSITRGMFERIVLPLNFRQMHLCDIPYLQVNDNDNKKNSDDDKNENEDRQKKNTTTTRWRLVLQSDFEWLSSFSKTSSTSPSSSLSSSSFDGKSIAQGVPANSVLLRSFEELRGGEWLDRSILRSGRKQCGTGSKSVHWRRGIEWVHRRLCNVWKTKTENSVFLHYVLSSEAHRDHITDELVGQPRRDPVSKVFKIVDKPGSFPALYVEMNLPTFHCHLGVVHLICIEEDFTMYRNTEDRDPLYRHAMQTLERYSIWPLSLEFALPPSRTNAHKVPNRIVRSANNVRYVERHNYAENPCRVDILEVEHEMESAMRRLVEERRVEMKRLMIEARRERREKNKRRAPMSFSPTQDFSSSKDEKSDSNSSSSNNNTRTTKRNPDDNLAILSMRMDSERLKIESLKKLQKVWWDVDAMKSQPDFVQSNQKGDPMTSFEGALKLSQRIIANANALHDHTNFQDCVNLPSIISERSLESGEILLECVARKRKIRESLKALRQSGNIKGNQALTNSRRLLEIIQDSASMQTALDEDFMMTRILNN